MSSDLAPGPIGVAELTVKNDVMGELRLDPRAFPFLELLLKAGGEAKWTWSVPEAMREMVADLILADLVVEREHIKHALQTTPDYLTIKITQKGRNVVEAHRQRKIVAGAVQTIPTPSF